MTSLRRRTLRVALATTAACSPVAFMVWTGCSSSSSDNGSSSVDPGGTFGAEVTLHIQGSGHVASAPLGLDCPTTCFRRFILDPNGDAAKTGVALVATPGIDWKFTGWTFNTTTTSGRGPGPEVCQPYSRQTSGAPGGADPTNPALTLPAGQVPATAPTTASTSQLACAGGTLPVAYDLTATFVYSPVPDAGPDVRDADAGDGGLEGEQVYPPPSANAVGKGIFYKSSRLVWQWDALGQSTISSGSTFPGSARTDVVGPGTFINLFRTDYAAVYQNQASTLADFVPGSFTVNTMSSPPTCVAVASDSSYVYCRSNGSPSTIYRWLLSGGSPTTLSTGLPSGSDLAVDSSYVYFSDPNGGNVWSIPLAGTDGGVPDAGFGSATLIASGQQSPAQVQVYSSYAYWTTNDGFGTISIQSASRLGGGSVTMLTSRSGIKTVSVDTNGGSYAYYTVVPSSATGASSIYKVSLFGGAAGTPVVQNLTNPGGVTEDFSYVYWTSGDGHVFRGPK